MKEKDYILQSYYPIWSNILLIQIRASQLILIFFKGLDFVALLRFYITIG